MSNINSIELYKCRACYYYVSDNTEENKVVCSFKRKFYTNPEITSNEKIDLVVRDNQFFIVHGCPFPC